jgi:hypothetical protein
MHAFKTKAKAWICDGKLADGRWEVEKRKFTHCI